MTHRTAPLRARAGQGVITSLVGLATILTLGCELSTEGGLNPNGPSELGPGLSGTWVSAASAGPGGFPSASDCTDLELTIVQQTGSTYDVEFTANCTGGVQLVGTATGILVDDVLSVDATGTATLPGTGSCPFTLTGTAREEGTLLRVDYSGNTCLGPLSGSELLERS